MGIAAQFAMVDAVIPVLEKTLGQQMAQLRMQEIGALASIALLALLAAWVACMLSRSITVPMSASVKMAQRVASCDLTLQAHVVGSDESAKLLRALNEITDSLVGIISRVRESIDMIKVAVYEMTSGNGDVSQRTESQASHLEQTVSSMEQLTSIVRKNADHAREPNQLVVSASDLATRGGTVVDSVIATMGGDQG